MLLQGKMFDVVVVFAAPLLRSVIEFLKMYLRIFVSIDAAYAACMHQPLTSSCRATISFHIFWLFLVADTYKRYTRERKREVE